MHGNSYSVKHLNDDQIASQKMLRRSAEPFDWKPNNLAPNHHGYSHAQPLRPSLQFHRGTTGFPLILHAGDTNLLGQSMCPPRPCFCTESTCTCCYGLVLVLVLTLLSTSPVPRLFPLPSCLYQLDLLPHPCYPHIYSLPSPFAGGSLALIPPSRKQVPRPSPHCRQWTAHFRSDTYRATPHTCVALGVLQICALHPKSLVKVLPDGMDGPTLSRRRPSQVGFLLLRQRAILLPSLTPTFTKQSRGS